MNATLTADQQASIAAQANPPPRYAAASAGHQRQMRYDGRQALRASGVTDADYPAWLAKRGPGDAAAPRPRKQQEKMASKEAPSRAHSKTMTPAVTADTVPVSDAVIVPANANHDQPADSGEDRLVAALLLPIAISGAVAGCMRLYGALEPAWHTTALAAAVIPLALEMGGSHFGKVAVKARSGLALLVCVLAIVGAAGIDYLAGTLGPQLAYRMQAGGIMSDAAAQLSQEQQAQQQHQASGDGREGPKARLERARGATEALRQQGVRAQQAALLTDRRLENAKPLKGEGLLTTAVTLGGSGCGVMVPLLLSQLLVRRRCRPAGAPAAAQEAASEPEVPQGGSAVRVFGEGAVETPERWLERLARWPLLRSILVRRPAVAGGAT